MLEYCSDLENTIGYQPDGYCVKHGQIGDTLPPSPVRLNWDIPEPVSTLVKYIRYTQCTIKI